MENLDDILGNGTNIQNIHVFSFEMKLQILVCKSKQVCELGVKGNFSDALLTE